MVKDIEAKIKNQPSPPTGYLRYRQLGIFEIKGGNPEFGSEKINERISSFSKAPAPLKFSTVPIYELVTDPTKKTWLKQAFNDYINENMLTVNQIYQEVEAKRTQTYKDTQEMMLYLGNVEQKAWLILFIKGCPNGKVAKNTLYVPRCTFRKNDFYPNQYLKSGQTSLKLLYDVYVERDPITGYARYRRGSTIGPWVKTGCSSFYIPFYVLIGSSRINMYNHIHFSFCIDCLSWVKTVPAQHNFQNMNLQCDCPTF